MTHSIPSNPESTSLLPSCNREGTVLIASSLMFAITTIALTTLMITQPHLGVGTFSAIGALESISFVIAIVSLNLYNRKHQTQVETLNPSADSTQQGGARLSNPLNPAAVIEPYHQLNPEFEIAAAELDQAPAKTGEILEQFKQSYPRALDAGEEFASTFVQKYFQAEQQAPQNLNLLHDSFEILRKELVNFFNDPHEIACTVVFTFLDKLDLFLVANQNIIQFFETEYFQTLVAELNTQNDPQLHTLAQKVQDAHHQLKENGETLVPEHRDAHFTAVRALLNSLYVKGKLPANQRERWDNALLCYMLDHWRSFWILDTKCRMKMLQEDFAPEGRINSTWLATKLFGARMIPSGLSSFFINQKLGPIPLPEARKKAMAKAGNQLFAVMLDPLYYGIVKSNQHPLRQKIEGFVCSDAYVLPEPDSPDWPAYIKTYTEFLEQLIQELKK